MTETVAPSPTPEADNLLPREPAKPEEVEEDSASTVPLVFAPERQAEFEERAAFGLSHVLYAKSPGGVLRSARRTAEFKPLIEQVVAGSVFDADLVEAVVFLESGGRPEVIAGADPAAAAGLTQIVAETGIRLLGMAIDLEQSRELSRKIRGAVRRGEPKREARLRQARRRVDPRFDPAQALAGTVSYLTLAHERFGREDLALVSYHMGIGNLESLLRTFTDASASQTIAAIVNEGELSYAQVYFEASPRQHAEAWLGLRQLGDDSRNYYWKVLAAREIMRLYREDRGQLRELIRLHRAKASAEEVLHPPETSERFVTPGELARAWEDGTLRELPTDPDSPIRVDRRMGELAALLDERRSLYRGLRPEALALLLYLADQVHELGGDETPLIVTSTVHDEDYQTLLRDRNPEATADYSLHTTGYTFDIKRDYGSPAQATAFQHLLERLEALALIAWVREPGAIHVTVSSEAGALIPPVLGDGPVTADP